MKIKHVNLLFLFAAIFTNNTINGANNDPVYQVMSPEVATYTRYGNYSVNYYTGTPNISIPIHEIKEREFESQIYLQYDASGFLPNRDATSVGQNWTLMCGGMITRQVRGIPDDKMISDGNVPAFTMGYWYGLKNKELAKDSSYLKNINNYYIRMGNGGMILNLPYEHEPDLFTFNANGDSFKFIIGNNGNVKVLGDRSCKVDLSGLTCQRWGSPVNESNITVTLDNGYKYIFGGSINMLEISYPLYAEQKWTPNFKEGVINSWYLKQVISPFGKPVATFDYLPQDISDNFIDQNYIQKNIYSVESEKHSFRTGCITQEPGNISDNGETISFTKLVYLTSITTTLSTIEFSYSPSTHSQYGDLLGSYMSTLQQIFKKPTYQLDSIVIKYKGSIRKAVKLNYEIASNEVVNYPNSIFSSRRFLNSVTINNLEKYSFEYNNSSILPYPITKKIDLDGYYNGIANNSLFPSVNFNSWQGAFNIDFSNRKTVKEYATIGMIKKATYPTGGYSTFLFEAHDYGSKVKRYTNGSIGDEIINESGYTGGARIKTITNSSGVTRSFDYKINGKSSGIYFNPQIFVYYYNFPFDNCSQITEFGISGNSLFDVATIAEPHIGYSRIKETRSNISGGYSDSVVYNYSNYKTNPDKYFCGPNSYSILTGYMSDTTVFKAEMNTLLNFSSCELDRGQLTKEEKYNSAGRKVQVTAYKYNTDPTKFINAVVGCRLGFAGTTFGFANAYATYLYSNNLTEKVDSVFIENGNSTIITETKNEYSSNNLLAATSIKNSNNDELIEKTKYPLDYSSFPNYQGIAHPIDMMKQLNMFNYPIEQKKYINGKLSNASITTYLINKNTYSENTIRPSAIYKLNIPKPEVDFTCLSAGDANNAYTIDSRMSQEINYSYNPEGTLKEVYSPKTGITTTYLWSYLYEYPVAEIKNATIKNVADALGETYIATLGFSMSPSESKLKSLNDLRYSEAFTNAQITTYTYKPLVGLNSMIDPRGVATNYTYDTFNRLYLARNDDKNIVGRYSYGYQNAPDNGQGGYTDLAATIITGATNYLSGANVTATINTISGGSGSYTSNWYLKNNSNTILASSPNSNSFTFNCSQTGILKVQCVITDNQTGQSTSPVQTISCYAAPTATVAIDASYYVLNGTGSATVTPGSGSGNYSYSWSLNGMASSVTTSTFSFTCSTVGTQTVKCIVTDSVTGQTATDTKTVTCYAVPTTSVVIGASYYMLNGTGTAAVTPGSGSGNYSYSWSLNGMASSVTTSTFSFTCSTVGTQTVKCIVTDNVTGQTATDTKTVTCYAVPTASVAIGASYYILNGTGTAAVTPGSGSGNYSYNWYLNGTASSITTNTFSFTCSTVGTQTVKCIITDNTTGQTATDTKTVTCYAAPTASVAIGASYYMLNGTGTATVTPGSGSGSYSYSWYLNGTISPITTNTFIFTPSTVGTQVIRCTVTDNITGQTVTSIKTVPCYAFPTGSVAIGASYYMLNKTGAATVTPGSGSGNYSYSWYLNGTVSSITTNTFSFTCSTVGTQTVKCIITDNTTGQTATDTKTVTCYATPTATVSFGASYYIVNGIGSATVTAENGSGNYSYKWFINDNASASTANTFSFTASSSGSKRIKCIVTDNITDQTITDTKVVPFYEFPTATVIIGASYYVLNGTGSATVTPGSGSGNYSYSWSINGMASSVTTNTFSFTCSTVGTQTVKCIVTDNTTGQTATDTKTVTCYAAPTASVAIGASYYMLNGTGTATVTPGSGSGNYSYSWYMNGTASSVTTNTFSFTCSTVGTQTVKCVVTDNVTGQTVTDTKTVTCYAAPTASVAIGASYYMLNGTGTATVTPGSGSGNYSYSWYMNGMASSVTTNTFSFTCSTVGTQTVKCIVTDNVTGQTATDTKTVTCYAVPTASVAIGALYYMLNGTGTATITPGSGSGNYSYSWSLNGTASSVTTNTFSFTCSTVGAQTVKCTVTDNLTGQTTTDTKTVNYYTTPNATVAVGTSIYISGETGSASLSSVFGGSGSYTYSWYLKNISGTVLANNLSTTSNSFSYICSEIGNLTIQCVITDNITGVATTVSTGINCIATSASGVFKLRDGYRKIAPYMSRDGRVVTFVLAFAPTSFPMTVGSNLYVADTPDGFQPSIARTITYVTGGRTWVITLNTDGSVYCKIVSGSTLSVGSSVSLGTLTYNL